MNSQVTIHVALSVTLNKIYRYKVAHPDINFWQIDWSLLIEFDMMRLSLAYHNAFTSTRNSKLLFLVSGFKRIIL